MNEDTYSSRGTHRKLLMDCMSGSQSENDLNDEILGYQLYIDGRDSVMVIDTSYLR